MSQEQQPHVVPEDWSYEMRSERKAAMGELSTLRQNRDARHEEESKQLANCKSFLKRWTIKCRSKRQDYLDSEREEELLEIVNPLFAFNHWREQQQKTESK